MAVLSPFRSLIALLVALCVAEGAVAQEERKAAATEHRVPAGDVSLYARSVGQGPAVIVLHGGPDFDHAYLLPDLDRLADGYRLIYYDQRGRGLSADGVRPEDVTLDSDVADISKIAAYFGLDKPILLGHSWGTVLALEYALRNPSQVSRLILMNPAPASTSDLAIMRKSYLDRLGARMEEQRQIAASAAYRAGDPKAVTARYRIHFMPALARREDYEKLMTAMEAQFARQGAQGILKARAVEDELMHDTWENLDYDLLPALRNLKTSTLVLTGDRDFIPVETAEHIARALPDSQYVVIKDCGHFTYLECPRETREVIDAYVTSRAGGSSTQ